MIDLGERPGASVLHNRRFLLLWTAQALSQTAQNAVFYALLVLVERRTGSTTHVGVYILSAIIPSVLFGIGAGVAVDHLRKRTVLVVTNLLRAPVVLAYVLVVLVNGPIGLVYVINFIFSTITQFFAPAEAAAIPLLVNRRQLIAANGLLHLTFVASQMGGFVLIGPPMVKLLGVNALLLAIAASYLVAALLVSFLPSEEPPRRPLATIIGGSLLVALANELKEGWALISRDRSIALAMLQLTSMATLILLMGELAPGFSSRVLGVPAEDAAYVLSPAGVGLLAGAVLVPGLAVRLGKTRIINAGLLILAVAFFALAMSPQIDRYLRTWLAPLFVGNPLANVSGLLIGVMVITLIAGWAFAMVVIPAQTILQERAPTHMRGRVFAVQITFGNMAALLPLIFLGAMADIVGIVSVIMILVLGLLAIAWYSFRQTGWKSSPPWETVEPEFDDTDRPRWPEENRSERQSESL